MRRKRRSATLLYVCALIVLEDLQLLCTPSTGVLALTETSLYHRCPDGFVSEGQRIDNQLARSQMDCADQCLRTMDCKAVNVFPYDDESGLTNCSLIGVHSPGICDGLSEAASESS
ncbi:hypothetical protein BaRGS_00029325 [Batillaria attramentaria]|uniref:Apple domain-containing protein n=1 Tax=Batillaria attramentaria TaxID=370345 RepID=A0ABD0JWX7_9CAEN